MFEVFTTSLAFIVATLLLLGGIQIGVAIGIGGLLTLLLNEGPASLKAIGFIAWGSLNNSTLSALPLFILMAEVMLRSGVSDSFYDGMARLIRRIPGGLLQTNIMASAIFSAVSGSSVATAAAIGSVAIPRQKTDGYDHAMLAGSVCAGGTLGNLIPPSIVMIIYATFSELSVAKLFIAGVIPGIVLTLMFMAYIAMRCIIDPKLAPPMPPAEKGSVWKGLEGGRPDARADGHHSRQHLFRHRHADRSRGGRRAARRGDRLPGRPPAVQGLCRRLHEHRGDQRRHPVHRARHVHLQLRGPDHGRHHRADQMGHHASTSTSTSS